MARIGGQETCFGGVYCGYQRQAGGRFHLHVEGGLTCSQFLAKLDQCLVGDNGISSTKEEPGFRDIASKTCQNDNFYTLVQNSLKHCNLLLVKPISG